MRKYYLLVAGLSLGGAALLSLRPAASSQLAPAAHPVSAATEPDVVRAAATFLATLSAEQRRAVVVGFNATNAAKWSNFPCGLGCREGLLLRSLSPAQQAAALAVVRAATGTVAGEGFDEMQQLRAADDNLAAQPDRGPGRGPRGGAGGPPPGGPPPGMGQRPGGNQPPFGGPGGGGYGSGIYAIAFLGQPTTTGTWMLQFGGHHLATNITFGREGRVSGATPKFEGAEPLRFTTADSQVLPTGTACVPLAGEAAGMLALLGSLTPGQRGQAQLTQSFRDVLMGPGRDGQFPTQKVGLAGRALTPAQRQLLLAALKPWVLDADDATAARLLAGYEQQLADTYVAYAGTGQLTQEGDYVRLDGPNAWVELVCQGGIVYRDQIHYHSIWRDRLRDYGGNFYSPR